MKAIQLLVNQALPEELRNYSRTMDSTSIGALMAEVARKHPEQYEGIAKTISDLGRKASYLQGETLTLSDMEPVFDRQALYGTMDKELQELRKASKNDDDFKKKRLGVWSKYGDIIKATTVKEALKRNSNLAYSVVSGARGSPDQLKMMVSTPALYTDSNDDIVPIFIRNSFGDGLRPAEYLAGTYGARKSVLSTKRATARGGDLAKQAVQSAVNIIVTTRDCGVRNGIDLDIDDSSLRNRVLGKAQGDLPAGTILDKQAIAKLRSKGIKHIIARSVLTCQAKNGVCAKCVGLNPKGEYEDIGSAIGVTASQAIGEPITQSALNCLIEGTLVRMADFSTKAIEDIEADEYVLGSDINGRTFPVKVLAKWDQGIQTVNTYTYRMGQTKQELILQATEAHPVLSNTKKSSCKEAVLNTILRKLPAGYKCSNVAAVLATSYDDSSKTYTPWATLLGVILGDGIRCTEDWSPAFSCADPKLIEDLTPYLKTLNLKLTKRTRSHDWGIVIIEDDMTSFRDMNTGIIISGIRNPLKQKLIEWGMIGKYAHDKRIPIDVFTKWNNCAVGELIAGFIATDGSVYDNNMGQMGISFSSCSHDLISDLKNLLAWRLGIPSTALTCIGRAGEGNRKHDQWSFTVTRISEIRKLSEIMPTIPGIKGQKFKDLLAKSTYTRNDDFYRCKRVSMEYLGEKHCWDISVDHPDELFVLANGLIVKNTKHQGGVATGKKVYSGFDVINRFVQDPEVFPDKAVVAEEDGKIDKITEAPQGGYYVNVNAQRHYIPPGYPLTVKVGDTIEAGEPLSDGLTSPGDIVRLRGVGEGRKYYADRLKQILDDSGMKADRRNTEMLARAALDHVRILDADPEDNYLPDDTVSYNYMAQNYTPSEDTKSLAPMHAIGKYLQAPVLHYTIGTRITPKMAKHIESVDPNPVHVSGAGPQFEPDMIRLRTAAHSNRDWLASMHTSYLKSQIAESATRGDDTNVRENTHFAPRLAIGEGFGTNIKTTGKF